jgi:hypothetical protein
VLAILIDNTDDEVLDIEPYMNGRESGFAVWNSDANRKIAFAEDRHNDTIALYVGTASDFSPQGNVPSEKAYKAARHFKHDEYLEAAMEAAKHLMRKAR